MLLLLLTLLSQLQEKPSQVSERISLAPHWAVGQEFLYRGSVKEENLSQAVQLTCEYRLEVRALVLSVKQGQAEVAFLTKLNQSAVSKGSSEAASVHLTIATIDSLGKITSCTHPSGLSLCIDAPTTWEQGWIIASPSEQITLGEKWEIAEPGRLPHHYQLKGDSSSQLLVQSEQHSNDWDSPRADSTAWTRTETLSYNLQQAIPQKVHRLIERRAPAHQKTTSRLLTDYELVTTRILEGPNLKAQVRDIELIRQFQQKLQTLASASSTRDSTQEFRRLGRDMERFQLSSGSTPFREAIHSLQALVQAGIENRLANLQVTTETGKPVLPLMPDFQLPTLDGKSTISLSQFHGRPCLLIFVRPDTNLTRQVMTWVSLYQHSLGTNSFVCLVLSTTEDSKVMQVSLEVPSKTCYALQGHNLSVEKNIKETPHFIVVNADGAMAGTYTGWGTEPKRDLEKLLHLEVAKGKK